MTVSSLRDYSLPLPGALRFSNEFLRQILLSLRLAAGSNYALLLRDSGLVRYLDDPPPPTPAMTFSAREMGALFRAIHAHLPAPQIALIAIKMGDQLAEALWGQPQVQALAAEVRRAPEVERVARAWEVVESAVTQYARPGWNLHHDDYSDYLTLDNCPYCADLPPQERPACVMVARFHEVMLHHLTGRAVVVREVACVAQGHAQCQFAVRRLRG